MYRWLFFFSREVKKIFSSWSSIIHIMEVNECRHFEIQNNMHAKQNEYLCAVYARNRALFTTLLLLIHSFGKWSWASYRIMACELKRWESRRSSMSSTSVMSNKTCVFPLWCKQAPHQLTCDFAAAHTSLCNRKLALQTVVNVLRTICHGSGLELKML